jgi:protein SCO1/2
MAQDYPVSGMVVSVDRSGNAFTASIKEIPGVMPAMTMRFDVGAVRELDALAPGAMIEFRLVTRQTGSRAEDVRVVPFDNTQPDPFAASRLALLGEIVSGRPAPTVAAGQAVPNFSLIDQLGQKVSLADFRGKVVAVNFIYTSCALPDFCLRLANHFNVLQKRFAPRLGRDLILLTLTFDPVHDTPKVLADYASQWNADPRSWHFLTGPEDEVRRICRLFGVQAFANEGLMDHSLHSVLIDRRGTLVANVEGNRFTPAQFGDLAEDALRRR